jgi:hypothetical protein
MQRAALILKMPQRIGNKRRNCRLPQPACAIAIVEKTFYPLGKEIAQAILIFLGKNLIAGLGEQGVPFALPSDGHGLRQRISEAETDGINGTGICPVRQIGALSNGYLVAKH